MAAQPADLEVSAAAAPASRRTAKRRVDVPAGAAGCDQDPHRRWCLVDWVSREIERRIPTAAKLTTQRRAAGAARMAA